MNLPDIDNLNFASLAALRNAVTERMKEMRNTAITQLRATISEQASTLGISVDDLMPKKGGKASRIAKYRDPADASNTWGGRGKRPAWLQAYLDAGRDKDEFLIT